MTKIETIGDSSKFILSLYELRSLGVNLQMIAKPLIPTLINYLV